MKNNHIKNLLLTLVASVGVLATITSCSNSKDSTSTVASATNLQLNFSTGEYSFTGASNARTYCIRLYGFDESGTQEDNYTTTSNNILASEENSSYSGTMDLTACTPGSSYNAYVLTRTEDYKKSLSEKATGTYIGVYGTPDATGITTTYSSSNINVTMAEATFDPYKTLASAPTSYTLTVYSGTTSVKTKTINTADLDSRDEDYTIGFGPMAQSGTYHHHSGSTTIAADADFYTITIKADAKDGFYYASSESEAVTVS
jgi:hypothetical protein